MLTSDCVVAWYDKGAKVYDMWVGEKRKAPEIDYKTVCSFFRV
jgi:hypothetical protein